MLCLLAALWSVALVGRARAHDFFLLPDVATPRQGELVRLELALGDAGALEFLPRDPRHLVHFACLDRASVRHVLGRDGARPAGLLRPGSPGPWIAHYRSRRQAVELPAADFTRYLREQGLLQALAWREQRGETGLPGRELFSRCAKALLLPPGDDHPGDAPAPQDPEGLRLLTTPVGLTLELTPLTDPARLGRDDWQRLVLPLGLTFQGEPTAGIVVRGQAPGHPGLAALAMTDDRGRVELALDEPGVWVLSATHMLPAEAFPDSGSGSEAAAGGPLDVPAGAHDWESVWTSLTLPVAGDPEDGGSARDGPTPGDGHH